MDLGPGFGPGPVRPLFKGDPNEGFSETPYGAPRTGPGSARKPETGDERGESVKHVNRQVRLLKASL